MSRESIHVTLTHYALNDLPECTCYAKNECFQDPSYEKHYVVCGNIFGLDNVNKMQ